MSSWPVTPADEITRLFRGFWTSQSIYAVVQLGIADILSEGPKKIDELAAAAGAHEPSLLRVMRLLAGEGIFAEREDGRFELTPMASTLVGEGSPIRLQVAFLGSEPSWRAAGNLLHTVRTGETAFEAVHGADFFEYYRQHPERRDLFDRLMAAQTVPAARAVAGAYDFERFATTVDVGGGRGALTIEILKLHEHLRGIVFDQPAVAGDAAGAIEAAGLGGRCEAVGGDMFESVPGGHDCYLLKYILHDWDDERCLTILRNCRQAISEEGRLLVIELLLPAGSTRSFSRTQDINMLVNLGGRERTEAEFGSLFRNSGFELLRSIPALGEVHIVEGRPV